jgi:protein-tyrosine-phosphatase
MKVLFVCKANVGRSQMAECIFNALCKEKGLKHKAESAGVDPGKWKGKMIKNDRLVNTAMREAGFDLGNQRSKKITKSMVKWADRVVLMNNNFDFPDYVSESKELKIWKVEDAGGRDLNFHRKIRDEIHILVNRLIDELED